MKAGVIAIGLLAGSAFAGPNIGNLGPGLGAGGNGLVVTRGHGSLLGGVTDIRLLGGHRLLGSSVGGLNAKRHGVLGTGLLRNPSQHR